MKSNQIYAEKCDFDISIFHPDKQFLEIQDVIRQKFESIYFEDEFGEQQGFISELVNQRLKIIPDSKVYLVNLKEKDGSYFLEFALIIITGISNYGGFREGFDYLKDDISHIFKQKLGDEYTVNVSYEITEITEKSKKNAWIFPNVNFENLYQNKNFWISIFAFAFLLFAITKLNPPQPVDAPKPLDEKQVELILDKKFDDYVKNRKMDMILERLILQPDTILPK